MKTNKYLFAGLFISLILHIALYLALSYLTKEKKPQSKEKQIYIKILPEQKVKKTAKVPKVKKEKKKGLPEQKKTIQKEIKNKIKKKIKNIKKQKPKKSIKLEKPKINNKKIVKKQKTGKKFVQPEKTKLNKEIKKQKIPKDKGQTKKNPPKNKNTKLPEINVSKDIEKQLKTIEIPSDLIGLKGKDQKNKISKDNSETKAKQKEIENYLKYIKQEFEKNKFYPLKARKLGIEGTVVVQFTILPDGTIDTSSIKIVYSDSPILSFGAKRIFEKIKKIPKPPPFNKQMTVEIPIEYILIGL